MFDILSPIRIQTELSIFIFADILHISGRLRRMLATVPQFDMLLTRFAFFLRNFILIFAKMCNNIFAKFVIIFACFRKQICLKMRKLLSRNCEHENFRYNNIPITFKQRLNLPSPEGFDKKKGFTHTSTVHISCLCTYVLQYCTCNS